MSTIFSDDDPEIGIPRRELMLSGSGTGSVQALRSVSVTLVQARQGQAARKKRARGQAATFDASRRSPAAEEVDRHSGQVFCRNARVPKRHLSSVESSLGGETTGADRRVSLRVGRSSRLAWVSNSSVDQWRVSQTVSAAPERCQRACLDAADSRPAGDGPPATPGIRPAPCRCFPSFVG